MSQADRLPTIKKIELSAKQLRPPVGSVAVGSLADGTVIWEGPIFRGNPFFQDHRPGVPDDTGHDVIPIMGPDGQQAWKRNRVTGEPIMPKARAKRGTKIVRFVMADAGNGNGGPRPVPTPEEAQYRAPDAGRSEYEREFFAAAQAEGVPASELAKQLAALAKPAAVMAEPAVEEPGPSPSPKPKAPTKADAKAKATDDEWEEDN